MQMGCKCFHKYPYNREAECDCTHRRGDSNVTVKAENGAMQPQVRGCQQSPQAGKGKK